MCVCVCVCVVCVCERERERELRSSRLLRSDFTDVKLDIKIGQFLPLCISFVAILTRTAREPAHNNSVTIYQEMLDTPALKNRMCNVQLNSQTISTV